MTDNELAAMTARTLRTLDTLMENDYVLSTTLVLQLVDDLRRLADVMEQRDVKRNEGSDEAQALAAWNLGLPIKSPGLPILVVKR